MHVKSAWQYLMVWGAGIGFFLAIYLLAALYWSEGAHIGIFYITYLGAAPLVGLFGIGIGAMTGAMVGIFFTDVIHDHRAPTWAKRYPLTLSTLIGILAGLWSFLILFTAWVLLLDSAYSLSSFVAVYLPTIIAGGMATFACHRYLRLYAPDARKQKTK